MSVRPRRHLESSRRLMLALMSRSKITPVLNDFQTCPNQYTAKPPSVHKVHTQLISPCEQPRSAPYLGRFYAEVRGQMGLLARREISCV